MSVPFDLRAPKAGERFRVAGLPGCAETIALSRLAARRRVLAIVEDAAAAARLCEQLRFLMEPRLVHQLVGWEVLPYDHTSPSRASVSERIATFAALAANETGVYVSAAADAALPCIPPQWLAGRALSLAVGQRIDLRALALRLAAAGCADVERVRAAGEFALYGGQLDLYPGGVDEPCRIVVEDELISQIRIFDPATQLSSERIDSFEALPAREYPLDEDTIAAFLSRWREKFEPRLAGDLYERIAGGFEAEGAEFFLPLFYGSRSSLFNYLSRRDLLWLRSGVKEAIASFSRLALERYELARANDEAALPPGELFVDAEEFEAQISRLPVLEKVAEGADADVDCGARELPPLAVQKNAAKPCQRLSDWLSGSRGRVVFPWQGEARSARVAQSLQTAGVKPEHTDELLGRRHGVFMLPSGLSGGFIDPQSKFAVVTEAEIHGYVQAPRALRRRASVAGGELSELLPGMLVIHEDHGVARYLGLSQLVHDDVEDEFITLEFADDVKLHVAVADCHLIKRHRQPDPDEEVKLHRLGGSRWGRQRAKAAAAARDAAAHLLEVYAKREAAGSRPPARFDESEFARFCAAFPHAETPDQVVIVAELIADLRSERPMDRLVCGDVGFGKTEIAMRAAWVAWQSGRQVAMITPTTLLAEQMFDSFAERFAGSGARIVGLSSLRAASSRKEASEELRQGEADIVIGTHSLLGKEIVIPNLGLVVIDEEHRFGVRQKERIRSLRANVDVLALSATPIPRTLAMALDGLRDMSLLATPPDNRLAVRTFVGRDYDSVIREALAREAARGGQSFVVHHRVQSIKSMAERVGHLLPGARIAIAHGQEPPQRLEDTMRRFYGGEIDVLVSTTIIESGIDVPNANTMIVPRAENFGLAQLHQLRGRVGRAARQAYAYFLSPLDLRENQGVQARLNTLIEGARLGSGYHVAVRDLEIRGAGELLGDAQSGVVESVGIETYRAMLAAAVRAGSGNEAIDHSCKIDFGGHARLPSDYCANPVERMRMYRRLAAVADQEELLCLRDEMSDRFGPLPLAARLLIDSHRLRLLAAGLGVQRIEATSAALRFHFDPDPGCADRIIEIIQSRSDCQLVPPAILRIRHEADPAGQLILAEEICSQLAA